MIVAKCPGMIGTVNISVMSGSVAAIVHISVVAEIYSATLNAGITM